MLSPIILNFSGPDERPVLRNIYRGLLQGSLLSPIALNLYMLPITQVRLPATMLLFADDVVIYHKYRNLQNATIAVQSWMDKFASTANKLFLHLSTNKCKSVLYTLRPFNPIISTIQFNDQHFEQLTSFKYLGVILDCKLSWKHHIYNIYVPEFLPPRTFLNASHLPNGVATQSHFSCSTRPSSEETTAPFSMRMHPKPRFNSWIESKITLSGSR